MVEDYEIQEMIHRDVYVGDKHVGVVVGERFHPRDEFVKSLRSWPWRRASPQHLTRLTVKTERRENVPVDGSQEDSLAIKNGRRVTGR